MVRGRVEHPLQVIKSQFGDVKTRYHGLEKNRAQRLTLLTLSGMHLIRRRPLV